MALMSISNFEIKWISQICIYAKIIQISLHDSKFRSGQVLEVYGYKVFINHKFNVYFFYIKFNVFILSQ